MVVALAVIAAVLVVLAALAFVFSTHVGAAGKPMWLAAGVVLAVAGIGLAVWAVLAGMQVVT